VLMALIEGVVGFKSAPLKNEGCGTRAPKCAATKLSALGELGHNRKNAN
jgi:hypothetical protein